MFFRVLLGSFESGVADRSGVAARMLHETCVGADAAERSIVLFRVEWLLSAMKGTSSTVAATIVLMFFLPRCKEASSCFGCVCARGFKGCFATCGCRSQCSGCVIVAIFCCHVRRCMRVCHLLVQIAL